MANSLQPHGLLVACQDYQSSTVSWSLFKFISIESVMVSNHFILCHPLLLLPSIFPNIRVFSNELSLHIRWPKYWSFSNTLSNEYSELISFRIDWFDLLAVQGALKSLLQHHSSKASILWSSAFFKVQLSHPYMTTREAIELAIHNLLTNCLPVCLGKSLWVYVKIQSMCGRLKQISVLCFAKSRLWYSLS